MLQAGSEAARTTFARSDESLSVLVFDNFYRDPDAVRAIALRQDYTADTKSDFPGLRSRQAAPPGMEEFFERTIGKRPRTVDTTFQYQASVNRDQLFVHGDRADWAGIVYLNPDQDGRPGTSFYRHRETGLYRAPDLFELIVCSRRTGKSPAQVIHTFQDDRFDLDRWEHLLTVPIRYNRLVVYDATRFHRNASAWGETVEDSRLVQGFFIRTGDQVQLEGGLSIRAQNTAFGAGKPPEGSRGPEPSQPALTSF